MRVETKAPEHTIIEADDTGVTIGPKNKEITLKIPSLVDDLHSRRCKLV